MKIQLLNYYGENKYDFVVDKMSRFSDYDTLDNYELNIIDLRDGSIWKNSIDSTIYGEIDCRVDFASVNRAILDTEKSKIIIFLPQNILFETRYSYIPLKDTIDEVKYIIDSYLCELNANIMFGKNITKINEVEIESDFYFKDIPLAESAHNVSSEVNKGEWLLEVVHDMYRESRGDKQPTETPVILSEESKKVVSYGHENKIFTTLNIDNNEKLEHYLSKNNLLDFEIAEQPSWMKNINMFDDVEQNESIKESKKKIETEENIISKAEEKLRKNNKYKSILYSAGTPLERVVKDILSEMLSIDLNSFVDLKKADIEFMLDDVPYVVEIKGTTSNVNTDFLGQLDKHARGYSEKNKESLLDIRKLLIINHQRKKPLDKREDIHVDIKTYAESMYKQLIIETKELIKDFEKFKKGEFTTSEFRSKLDSIGIYKSEA